MNDSGGLPLVSIVTPSLNQAEFIEDTIRSVLGQDYPNTEYLVVDGGSDDGTLEILRRFEDRLRWTSGPDDGQSDAINRGFAASSGEIIAWLNADDRYLPGAIRAALGTFMQDPTIDLVYAKANFIDRLGGPLGPCLHVEEWDLGRLVNRLNFVVQPAAFFRRAAFNAVGGLDSSLHYVMDYDLWVKLGRNGHVQYVPSVLAEVRVYPETKTASGGLPRLDEMERMARRYGRRIVPVEYQQEMVRALAEGALKSARRGSLGTVVRCLWRLIHYGSLVGSRRASGRLRRLARPGT